MLPLHTLPPPACVVRCVLAPPHRIDHPPLLLLLLADDDAAAALQDSRSFVPANRTSPPSADPSPPRLEASQIRAAVEGSLRRLQTPYIDLIQLHWWGGRVGGYAFA